MATFVLVHGSFFGGWCWDRVVPRLREHGHDVVVPTLTGLGEREHLASADVGLEVHTRDVLATIRYGRLHDIVLVGHSYGGMVITGVAAAAPDVVGRLVYLDGFVPRAGQSAFDILPWTREAFEAAAREHPEGLVPPFDLAALGIASPDDVAWVEGRVTPLSLRTHAEPSPGVPEGVRAVYLRCAQGEFFADLARGLAAEGWPVVELAAGHMAMVTEPAVVADALLAAVD